MTNLDDLLVGLAGNVPCGLDHDVGGAALTVEHAELVVPVETRIAAGGAVLATLPRGRMATGFQLPHGRLTVRLEVRGE